MTAESEPPAAASASVINRRGELRDAVFFDGPNVRNKISRYWMLLVLAVI